MHASRANQVSACGLAHPQLVYLWEDLLRESAIFRPFDLRLIYLFILFPHIFIKIHSQQTKFQISIHFVREFWEDE